MTLIKRISLMFYVLGAILTFGQAYWPEFERQEQKCQMTRCYADTREGAFYAGMIAGAIWPLWWPLQWSIELARNSAQEG